jgi:phosphoribosylaminoimidazolecarboxamide formyltransferase/IMP cyclohydrolase
MKRALLSVSNKKELVPFAKGLLAANYEIISTGGTYAVLKEHGIDAVPVESITNFPEILDGRVKTLHPNVHGGLLARRDDDAHMAALKELNITPIDLVCVNLYPFEATIKKEDISLLDAIEQIDIGGPSMLRSAAKNFESVTVVCDPLDYSTVLSELKETNTVSLKTKKALSAKVFRHTAAYDSVIADYLTTDPYPEKKTLSMTYVQSLRYGENPHQTAALYQTNDNPYSVFNAKQIHGKALSYNNIQDANAAINILKEHALPTVVGLKHMNPCGVASHDELLQATIHCIASDPVSIFGGIIAMNRPLTLDVAKKLSTIFLEIIIAPSFSDDAKKELSKKKNLRLLVLDTLRPNEETHQITSINGGLLVQSVDDHMVDANDLVCVTKQTPSNTLIKELLFGWRVVKHVKSNAIVITKGYKTVGIGAGQMNRVGAAEIALKWAKDHGHKDNLMLSSDAFLPFDDVVRLAHQYGVTHIIQPGGSIRDQASIDACNELGVTMVFTSNRHFKH